jgi:hypothetical protein
MIADTIVVDSVVHPYDALDVPSPWSALRGAARPLPA